MSGDMPDKPLPFRGEVGVGPRPKPIASSTALLPTPSLKGRGVRSTAARQAADSFGRRGEDAAAAWLERRGWTVLARRVKTKAGEVDLVARRDALVAFVEVKARKTVAELDFAIDERRLARVAAAAEMLMERFCGPGDDLRVDVLLLAPGTPPRHIENAWIG